MWVPPPSSWWWQGWHDGGVWVLSRPSAGVVPEGDPTNHHGFSRLLLARFQPIHFATKSELGRMELHVFWSRPRMGLMYSVILIVKIKVKPWQPCTRPIFFVAFHSFYLELFQAFVEIRSFVAIVIEEGCNHIWKNRSDKLEGRLNSGSWRESSMLNQSYRTFFPLGIDVTPCLSFESASHSTFMARPK